MHKVKEEETGGGGGGEVGEEVEETEQDNQPAIAANGDKANKPSPGLNRPDVPQTEEPTGLQREEVADGDSRQQQQQNPHSHSEEAALR